MKVNTGSNEEATGQVDAVVFLAGGGEMGKRIHAFDWAKTPLGPIDGWPQSLKTTVRLLLSSRYPMFVWWGRSLINIYNDAYIPILGARHPRALGQPAKSTWTDVWPVVGPQAEVVLNEGRATWNESVLLIMERHGYTEETYFTFSYSPVQDDEGNIHGVFCACTDDTRRVIGERQLALLRDLASKTANARTWQEVCDSSTDALNADPCDLPFAMIYLAEPDGQRLSLAGTSGIERGHPAAPETVALAEATLWPFASVFGTRDVVVVDDLHAAVGAPLPAGAWQDPPSRAALIPIAATGQTGRGGVLVVGLNPFRLFDDDYRNFLTLVGGQISASIASAQAYEEEKKRAEVLTELDRAKTAFFSNVSHEFRTPLTLLLSPVEEMLNENDTAISPELKDQLEMIHRNSLRLQKLVNTMLDFSRIEAGRIQVRYEPLDLAAYTADLASVFRAVVEQEDMRLIIDCRPLPEPVYVDRDMWEKIVLNLLSNAFKFTLAGEIEVRLAAVDGQVQLTVRDTGVGIPADALPHIFERFHRVQEARGRTYEGTGIGLTLVLELAKLHGGTVHAESVLNEGSRFTVTVPMGTAHLNPHRIINTESDQKPTRIGADAFVQEALRWLSKADSDQKQAWMRDNHESIGGPFASTSHDGRQQAPRPRIVLADDNADMRAYVSRLLGSVFDVEAFADGRAALEAVQAHPPDLVLCDVMMPRLDGFGLLHALRNEPKLCDIPIILLSARAGDEARIEGMEAGADDYMIKPFSARELLARVEAHVSIARLRRESNAALRESEARFARFMHHLPGLAWIKDAQGRYVYANGAAEKAFRTPREQLYGKTDEEIFPPETAARFRENDRRALASATGIQEVETLEHEDGVLHYSLVNKFPIARTGDQPAMVGGIAIDITERMQAEEALRKSEERFRLATSAGRVGVWDWDVVNNKITWSDTLYAIHGVDPASFEETVEAFAGLIHPEDRTFVQESIRRALHEDANYELEFRILRPDDGGTSWVYTHARVVRDASGAPVRMLGGTVDITERKKTEQERNELLVREQEARAVAETLNEVARTLAVDLDLHEVIQRTTDAATILTGAKFGAFFYNVIDDQDETYLLYTLSGAPREAFEQFGLPRNTTLFGPTFRGEDVVRLDDVLADPRYGQNPPHQGMPEGHLPVRSYMAVPVVSRAGTVLGGLFFGHPEPGVFTEHAERLAVGIAAQAAIALDNARLFKDAQQEIARRKQSEAALRAAAEVQTRLAAIVEASDDAIVSKTLEGIIQSWNAGAERIFGYTADEATGQSINLIIPPELRDEERSILERLGRGERIDHFETERVAKDGSRIDISLTISPLIDDTGRVIGAAKVARDISDRKRAEAALRAKEAELKLIAETTPLILTRCSRDLRYRFVNRAAAALLNRTPDEIVGQAIIDVIGEETFAVIRPYVEQVLRGEQVEYESELVYPAVGPRWVHANYLPDRDRHGNVVGWIASVVDVTERKEAEEALRELNETLEDRVEERTRQVRELARRLTMAEQEERRRISQILHDNLQQLLFGIKMKIGLIRRALQDKDRPIPMTDMEEARTLVDQAIKTTRQLTVDLSPPILQNEGLAEALEWLQSQMYILHGLTVVIDAEHSFYLQDEDLRVLLVQIVRELLFNVKKHAGVDEATVRLTEDTNDLVIHIIDDGKGFDVDEAASREGHSGGFGLFNVRERLILLGGRLVIRSRPGEGTHLEVHVPIHANQPE